MRVLHALAPHRRLQREFYCLGLNERFLLNELLSTGTHISAILPGGLCGQRLDFLPVKLSRTAVVLGVGVTGGTPVLVEEGRLQRKAGKLT